MEFCNCGSIKMHGNCTNRRCVEHKRPLVDGATYHQIEYIKKLSIKNDMELGIDFDVLSKKEASSMINELLQHY